jgi:hypothetical protein
MTLLIAIGLIAHLIREQANSPTLKTFFFGNFIIQIGLFSIEFVVYCNGIITTLSGDAPNLVIHLILAFGFAYSFHSMKNSR